MKNKIKWFLLLLKAAILRKATYQVSFTKESNGGWYVDFPNWPLSHGNLAMVCGADDLLDILNKDNTNHVSLVVKTKKPKEYDIELQKVHSALTKGAYYTVETPLDGWERPNATSRKQLWLCPVTLTVLGHYPKSIYFKQLS